MLKIGLTGGIGSGKTTVANLFAALAVPVIDADAIAQQLTEPNALAYHPVVAHFGTEILDPQKLINRQQLRQIIFADPNAKKWLEELLHPLIRRKIHEDLLATDAPYGIIVIPLLIEAAAYDLVDRILVVDTTFEDQIRRTIERDHISRDSVLQIMTTQAKREDRIAAADDVILNNDDLYTLQEQVDILHDRYTHLATAPKK